MKTITKLRSSAPALLGAISIMAAIAFSAIAHPHAEGAPQTKRRSWNQPDHRPQFGSPRGHQPRRVQPPDPRVRKFLFAPRRPRPRSIVSRPANNRAALVQAPLKSPFLVALDVDRDGFIDEKEIAQAAEALRAMDLNNDGKVGPAEWKPRRGPLPIERNAQFQPDQGDGFRGKQATKEARKSDDKE